MAEAENRDDALLEDVVLGVRSPDDPEIRALILRRPELATELDGLRSLSVDLDDLGAGLRHDLEADAADDPAVLRAMEDRVAAVVRGARERPGRTGAEGTVFRRWWWAPLAAAAVLVVWIALGRDRAPVVPGGPPTDGRLLQTTRIVWPDEAVIDRSGPVAVVPFAVEDAPSDAVFRVRIVAPRDGEPAVELVSDLVESWPFQVPSEDLSGAGDTVEVRVYGVDPGGFDVELDDHVFRLR